MAIRFPVTLLMLMLVLAPCRSLAADSFVERLLQVRAAHLEARQENSLIVRQLAPDEQSTAPDTQSDLDTTQRFNPDQLTRQLLGLYVDEVEKTALLALHDGEQYLLPLATVLDLIGASVSDSESVAGIMEVNTPGGPARLGAAETPVIDGQIMVTEQGLRDRLLVDMRFDQSSYALYLTLPWSLSATRQGFAAADMPDPDFAPPAASVRSLRGDVYLHDSDQGMGSYGDYYMAGNLLGGAWQSRVARDSFGQVNASDYFFTRDFANTLALFGNADYSLHPLLPTTEQTGVQMLYSSRPLSETNEVDISRAHGVKRLNNGVRSIAGVTRPGAIAELLVDGKVRARTRARLDGTYEFPGVELPSRGYSEVLVYITDHRSGALLETQDHSRRSGVELLGDGQHSVFAALGEQGNPLDESFASVGESAALQWRYGLTEDLTLELGHQQVGGAADSAAALSMALSRKWFAAVGVADNSDKSAASLDVEGGSDNWSVDFSVREMRYRDREVSDQAVGPARQWNRYFNARYQLSDNLSIGLTGRDSSTSAGLARFALPSMSWSNRRNLTVNVRPNYNGDYRVDSRLALGRSFTARYSFEQDAHLVDFRHLSDQGHEYFVSLESDARLGERAEFGMVSYFENPRLGRIQFGMVGRGNEVGYALDWESRLLPGVNSRLRVSQRADDFRTENEGTELSFQWQLTFDFAVAQRRIVPADTRLGALDRATLTGDLMLDGKRIGSDYDIQQIDLLIDGDTRTARVQGGRFYLEGLEPGMHRIAVDSAHLPLELSPVADQRYWVRLERSAATEMPLALEVNYSAAGRVRDTAGNNIRHALLFIYNAANEKIGQVTTDQFGLYRTSNLAPGHYRIDVRHQDETLGSREFTISDDYLFEQDIEVPAARRPAILL